MSNRPIFDAVKPVDRDWMVDSLCRGLPVDLFYPNRAGAWNKERLNALSSLCGACSVADQCRAYARATGDNQHGWWGGLPDHQPKKRRRVA